MLNTIRSTPPPDVLEVFEGAYGAILQYKNTEVDEKYNDKTIDKELRLQLVENGVRLCLDSLSVLGRNFQTSSKRTRFAANIMLYIPIEDIPSDGEERADILNRVAPFVERKSFDGLKGVLNLVPSLSASTDDSKDSFAIDKSLSDNPIVLPIPAPSFSVYNNKQRFLPGAPTAFENGNHLVADTRSLLSEYDTNENNQFNEIPRSVFQKVDNYFHKGLGGGMLIRSVFSILIKESEKENATKLGVVNIHCDKPNFFEEEWVSKAFLILTAPFLGHISELLIKREQILKET